MQVGAADVLIGDLLDHLRAPADLGGDAARRHVRPRHQPHAPDIGRMTVTEANSEEVYRVPTVHQGARARPRRGPRRTGIDARPPPDARRSARGRRSTGTSTATRSSTAARRPSSRGCRPTSTPCSPSPPAGPRSSRTATTGSAWPPWAHGDLVGTRRGRSRSGEPSAYARPLDQADLFADLPTDEGTAPFVLPGVVAGRERARRDLVVAVNGRIAGVARRLPAGRRRLRRSPATSPTSTGEGANEVVVYEVERRRRAAVTLHPVRRLTRRSARGRRGTACGCRRAASRWRSP